MDDDLRSTSMMWDTTYIYIYIYGNENTSIIENFRYDMV